MSYTAMMVDITNSKKLSEQNREAIQLYIKQSLNVLNNVFSPSLVFDVIFSAGDEVQGLFKTPCSAFMYYRLFKLILAPLQMRCGFGVGEWNVKIIDGTSAEQDGSAYHNAREAITHAHNAAEWSILFNSNSDNDFYINTLLNSSSLLSRKQSIYQNAVSLLIELVAPFFDASILKLEGLQEILILLQNKENVNFYSLTNDKNDNLFKNIHTVSYENDPIQIFSKSLYENKILLNSTIKKGTSTKISNITNTTRQNIDNIIGSANISSIRNIDLTAILFMHKNY
jgi:hypothetical protein